MQSNNITPEQAGGKIGVWGITEQLLVNKNITKEVKSLRRSLTAVWLDYKNVFDSVPESWLIYALKLAKVPPDIINVISNLTDCWYNTSICKAKITYVGSNQIFETNFPR